MADEAQKPAGGEYEFNAEQNGVIRDLANVMSVAGLVLMALGIVVILYTGAFITSTNHDPTPMIFAAFCAPMVIAGFWIRGAAEPLLKIVDTQGSDVSHLMTTFRELRRIFALLRTGFAVSLFVAVAGLLLRVMQ